VSHSSGPGRFLLLIVVCLAVVLMVGPALVALAHVLVPLVIAAGIVAAILRLVWFFTTRF
jgi:membrane associated rhomboid family serine protease